jgi:hypothetical protein
MDAELNDFRRLMIKGLSLKDITGENVVVYIDINATTLFCGKMKNSKDATYYLIKDFNGTTKYREDGLNITFGEKNLVLNFSQCKVRDYMHRMLERLFTEK